VVGSTTSQPLNGAEPVERVIDLPPSSAAPVEARRAVAAIPGMGGDLGYRALLLTSESVTAAVLAAESQPVERILVRAKLARDQLRIEVDPVGGRGVQLSAYARRIFERTASRWGTAEHPAIWFELGRPAYR
jgi:hypothetical protein